MEITIDMHENLLGRIDHALGIQRNMSRNQAFNDALESWVRQMPTERFAPEFFKSVEYDPDFVFDLDRPGPDSYPSFRSKDICTCQKQQK